MKTYQGKYQVDNFAAKKEGEKKHDREALIADLMNVFMKPLFWILVD